MVKDKKLCFPVKVNLFFREYLRIYNVSSVSGRLIELTVFDLFSDSLFMKHFLKVFIFSAAVQSVFGWELKKDSEGIRVYVQEKKGSAFNECRAETVYKGTLEAVLRLMRDSGSLCEWFPDCVKYSVIKRKSSSDITGLIAISAGFPLKKRDAAVRMLISENPSEGSAEIHFISVPDAAPVSADFLRVKELSGAWRFRTLENNRVSVEYTAHMEPGGSVPAVLVNAFLAEFPFKSFQNFLKKVREYEK